MGKITLSLGLVATLIVLATLCQLGNGAMVPTAAGFKYLGSIKTSSNQASGYFLSQNSAGWSTAANDCKRIYGPAASLVYIETQDELDRLTMFFEGDDTGTLYWSGGRYDPRRNSFTWHNGVLFEEWAPWEAGFPDTKFSTTRVAVIRDPGLDILFQTHLTTVSLRYICEFPM